MASINDITALLDKKLGQLKTEIVEEITKKLKQEILKEINENLVEMFETYNKTLEVQNQRIQEQNKRLVGLEEHVGELTNRNMRNNIVIKGIKEDENETWDQTEKKVATFLQDLDNEDINYVHNQIERAHRGGKKRPKSEQNYLCQIILLGGR